MSIRLHFVVEGQTEEEFVKRVLAPYLGTRGIFADARCVMTSKQGAYWRRGGLLDYRRAHKDITLWMKEDTNADAWFTTMFDLYALPPNFPQYAHIGRGTSPYDRVERLEQALVADIRHRQFVPYLQLHEFEALIFAEPEKLKAEFIEHNKGVQNLVRIALDAGNPEKINDGEHTAPSKRIIKEIPEYEGRKVSAGPLVVEKIGLDMLRSKCAHFGAWVSRLENLSQS